jgi:hypothetical protein
VHSVPLDTWLNLLWLAISVFALVHFGRCGWRRSFIVFLATIALFPIVSDSDDLFSFSRLRIPVTQHRDAGTAPEDSREKDTVQLSRLIESLDHYQPASSYQFVFALCFFALLIVLQCAARTRSVIQYAGRAPPVI